MEYIRKLQKSKGCHDVKKMVADTDVEKCKHIAITFIEKVNEGEILDMRFIDFKYIDEDTKEVQLQVNKLLSKSKL